MDLPGKNRTTDAESVEIAAREHRVVIKDADFVNSFLLTRQPQKLLLISTGNITNAQLEALLIPQISSIASTFEAYNYVELIPSALVIHV